MSIQWFPGHMTSARKKAAESMERIDVVIEVLDARLPEASSNPMIRELRLHRQRPCLKILNKAVLHQGSEIPNSNGDEPGVLKGVVSNTVMDKTTYKTFSSKVFVEGSKVVTHLKTTAQNGSNANMPAGSQVSPSQTTVIIVG